MPDLPDAFASLHRGLLQGSYIRAVNFHNTPTARRDAYRRQLAFYAEHFAGVTEGDLEALLTTGRWDKARPGLILAFFNGYRNNFDVMAPLLKQFGFTGWFFVPTDFASEPPASQADFAAQHHIQIVPAEYSDGRLALNWDEIRALSATHVIASHTKTHARVSREAPEAMRREIVEPQQAFMRHLGRPVNSFAWLWGSEFGLHPDADALVLEAGYKFLFSNQKIQRISSNSDAG